MNPRPDWMADINLPNAGSPLPGLVTAGQPDSAQFEELARAGVKTVIDLRPPEEPRGFDEPQAVRAAGLEYYNIPVSAPTLGDAQFSEFRKHIGAKRDGTVLVHCASANRVGALLIPYLLIDKGRSRAEALEIARSVGLRSDDMARAAIRYAEKHQRKNSGS